MGKQAHTREEACSLQPAESRLVSEGDKYRDWKGAQDNIGVKKKTDKKTLPSCRQPRESV